MTKRANNRLCSKFAKRTIEKHGLQNTHLLISLGLKYCANIEWNIMTDFVRAAALTHNDVPVTYNAWSVFAKLSKTLNDIRVFREHYTLCR